MARKKTPATQFGEFMSDLSELFSKANRAELEAAIKSKDFAKMSEVVGIPEKQLRSLQLKGRKLALGMLGVPLKEAAAVFKKSTKNRQ